MNKNKMLAALLVAVSCQSVSAIPFFSPKVEVPASMMDKVAAFAGSHKGALAVTAGVGALLVAGYKHTREQIWVEGNCVKFRSRGLFYRREGSVCFKSHEDALAAQKVMSLGTLRAAVAVQRTFPNCGAPRVMTSAEKEQFDRSTRVGRRTFQAAR